MISVPLSPYPFVPLSAGGRDNAAYSFTDWALAHAVVSSQSYRQEQRWTRKHV